MHKGLGALFHGFFCFLFLCSYGQTKNLVQTPIRHNFRRLSPSTPLFLSLDDYEGNLDLNVQIFSSEFINWNSVATSGNLPMSLALYNSQTLLSNGCLNFLNSDYIQDTLSQDLADTSIINFPYFQVQDYYVVNSLSASSEGLNFPSTAIIATSCTSSPTSPYGNGSYGLIGMGTQGRSLGSFGPVFSIYFSEDSSTCEILVGSDPSYEEPHTFANTLTADENWQVHGIESIQLGSYAGNVNLTLIFDMNANTIGLPLEIFQNVVSALAAAMQINCSNATYQPYCDYVGGIHDFPNLLIVLGNDTITIPPDVYVFEGYEEMAFLGSLTLNLRAISPNLSNQSYVTPAYSNYIILDYHVLTYYYAIFDASAGNKIILYDVDRVDYITIYILIANAGLLLVLGTIYCLTLIKRKSVDEKDDKDKDNKTEQKPTKKEDKKAKKGKKSRRAGMISRNATMVYNRDDYQNTVERDQSHEEKAELNIISADELSQKLTQSKESTRVQEVELAQITRPRDPEDQA